MAIMRRTSWKALAGFAVTLALAASIAAGADLPVNTWSAGPDAPGKTSTGLVYLPASRTMLLWGPRTNSVFDPASGQWSAAVGAAPLLNGRGTSVTDRVSGAPRLPGLNVGFWASHQMCYLPDQKKVLYFLGGSTFMRDPATGVAEDLKIALDKAPPDVLLGSMAWDPVNKRAVLFGGGYLWAYKARQNGQIPGQSNAWTPEAWDRRGTWAFDPATNTWRKLTTASKDVIDANAVLTVLGQSLRTLWGATRGVAFEYGDMVRGRKPAELAGEVEQLAGDLATFAKDHAGKGGTDYEKWQFATAARLITTDIALNLKTAADALRADDGWKAFRALDAADRKLVDAQEILAVAPPPRHYARLVLDPENKVLVLFGGDGEDRWFADTWLLHLDSGRWERCRVGVHPPVVANGMVAMDYDSENKVLVLAAQDGSVWTFETAKQQWKRRDVAGAANAKGSTWQSLEYDPAAGVHVLVVSRGTPGRTAMLRLDLAAGKTVPVKPSPEEVWRPQYGAGCSGAADKYDLAWSFLPRTQAAYREKVAAHKKVLDGVAPNSWTQLPHVYSGFGRAYGSFCYDWDRDEICLWGGGHSAYMGNEWSQYDLKSNLWMESWNPEFAVHPHDSPDGPGWTPQFQHRIGAGHGYHHYVYCSDLKRVQLYGSILYDPDRMRYDPATLQRQRDRFGQSAGIQVEMNGAPGLFSLSARHWYGGPFGVWQADLKALTIARIKDTDTPFGANDRFKSVFDTTRRRVLAYGATNDKAHGGKSNALWAYSLDTGRWEKIEPKVEPEGAAAPAIKSWNYCYSPKYDCLFIADRAGTWVYDCAGNTTRRLNCKPQGVCGVIYSARQDLFYALDGNGYRQQQVWVFRYRP